VAPCGVPFPDPHSDVDLCPPAARFDGAIRGLRGLFFYSPLESGGPICTSSAAVQVYGSAREHVAGRPFSLSSFEPRLFTPLPPFFTTPEV